MKTNSFLCKFWNVQLLRYIYSSLRYPVSTDAVTECYVPHSVFLFLCVIWDPQQRIIKVMSLATVPRKESNIKFTYRHLNCYGLFFCQLDCAVLSVVWTFYRAHFRKICTCRKETYLHRNKWRVGLLIALTT